MAINALAPSIPSAPKAGKPDPRYGVEVNDHPIMRSGLMGVGVGALAGGVAAFALMRTPLGAQAIVNPQTLRTAKIIALSSAGGGAVLAGLSTMINPTFTPYMTGLIDTRAGAEQLAASYDEDIAVHKNSNGKYGLIELKGKDVDNKGPEDAKLGNRPVQWESIATRDGDLWRRSGSGWSDTGAFPGPRTDLTKLDGSKADDRALLAGTQFATNSQHQVISIGTHQGADAGYDQLADVVRDSFERTASPVAILRLGDTYHAFSVNGPYSGDARARGTMVQPFGSLQVLSGAGLESPSTPGSDFGATAIPTDPIAGISVADAGKLSGRRIGVSTGGGLVRVGKVVGDQAGYGTMAAAGKAAYDMGGGQHVVLQLQDRFLVFDVQGGPMSRLQTMLGPSDRVTLQDGKKLFRAGNTQGVLRFIARSTPFEVDEPITYQVQVNGRSGTGGQIDRYVHSYDTKSAAEADMARRYDDGYALIRGENSQGAFHLYKMDNSRSGASWDQELGKVEASVKQYEDERTTYETTNGSSETSATVYRIQEQRDYTVLYDADSGSRTTQDTGWDVTSRTVDTSRTQALRDELRRAREQDEYDQQHPNNGGGGTNPGGGNSTPGGNNNQPGDNGGGYGGGNNQPGDTGGGYGGGNNMPSY